MNNGFYEFSRGKQETTSSVFPYTGSAIISGSLTVTGSMSATQGFTGSLFGTSSFATSSSFAQTASFAISASWAPTQTIDTGSLVTTSSFNAFTSSYNTGSFTGSFNGVFTGSLFGTASRAISASYAVSGGNQNFQQVTNNGNVTTNQVVIGDSLTGIYTTLDNSGVISYQDSSSAQSTLTATQLTIYDNATNKSVTLTTNEISLDTFGGIPVGIKADNVTTSYVAQLPNKPSGSYIFAMSSDIPNTSSFATTGSNQFSGSQIVTGVVTATRVIASQIDPFPEIAQRSISLEPSRNFIKFNQQNIGSIATLGGQLTAELLDGNYTWYLPNKNGTVAMTNDLIGTGSFVTTSSFNSFTSSYNTGSFTGSFTGDGSGLTNISGQSVNTSSLATTGSNTFIGNQVITGSLTATQGITGSLFGTASWATNANTASYALNGGVTQLLAGANVTLSPTNGLGQVTISSTSGGGGFNTATGSYGSFYDTTIQTNVAGTARSMSLNTTDITNGVSVSGSTNPFNTYIKTENAGVYDIQFSAQVDKTDSGTDEIWIWLRKNGTNLADTATSVQLTGNGAHYVAAWNFFVNAAANDYFQLMWYSPDANVRLHAEPAFGVVPGIPSLIVTVNRVDQFLSNTGSFSGQFSGSFSGSGANLSEIPASAITGLNLSQLATGSVTASVSPTQFTISSASVDEFTVTGTGVTLGSVLTDTHRVTGSLNVTGSITATTYNNLPTASVSSSGILSSTDWIAFSNRKRQIVNDTTSVTTTGVAVATLVKTYEITTGTLPISGFLDIFMYLTRSGATSGAYTLSISVNSVNNFATSTFIAGLSTPGNFVQTLPLKAKFVLKSGTITGANITQSTGDNYLSMTSVPTPVTCNNTAGSVWFFVYVTPSSSGQSWTLQGVEITI